MVIQRSVAGPLVAICALLTLSRGVEAAPVSVGLIANFQSELGCPTDFDVGCPLTQLAAPSVDTVRRETLTIMAGDWSYKAVLDGDLSQNVGAGAALDGANIGLSLAAARDVRFYYDEVTHWLTDNVNSVIATLAGSFQSELGCVADFTPSCLRSWLQDVDGDGIYEFSALLPQGAYSTVVAHDESFAEVYGSGGVPGGSNIDFMVPREGQTTLFRYDAVSHVLTIQVDDAPVPAPVPLPASALLLGAALAGLGLLRRR